MWYTLPGSGSNAARYVSLAVVRAIVCAVRPWNPPRNARMTGRPVATRASLTDGLDRLGARVRQERLPRTAGQDVPKALVQPEPRLVVQDVLLAVEELGGLRRDGRRDARMGMPRVGHADPRRVVEVARAVTSDQPRALAAVDVEVRDPAPDRRDDGVVREVGGRPIGRRVVMRARPRYGGRARASSRIVRRRLTIVEAATSPTAVRKMIVPTTLTCGGMPIRALA